MSQCLRTLRHQCRGVSNHFDTGTEMSTHFGTHLSGDDSDLDNTCGSRLEYANAVLYGISSKNIQRLQRIKNALARCIVDSKVHWSSNALLQQLHWLPIHHRIDFKLAKLAFLALSSATSSYLNSSVARYLPSRTLHSQDTCLLVVPKTKTVFGSIAFRVADHF